MQCGTGTAQAWPPQRAVAVGETLDEPSTLRFNVVRRRCDSCSQDLIGRAAELATCRASWPRRTMGGSRGGASGHRQDRAVAFGVSVCVCYRLAGAGNRPGEREKDLTDRALVELLDDHRSRRALVAAAGTR